MTWNVERTADHKGYHLTGGATFTRGLDGWYQPTVTLVDDRGCSTNFDITATQIADVRSTGTVASPIEATVKLLRPVARATMQIEYAEAPNGDASDVTHSVVFNDAKTLDASLNPPAVPIGDCASLASPTAKSKKTSKLTTSERLEDLPRNQQVAIAIASAGFACARVTDLYPDSAGEIIAHCTEYRSGRGRATYRIDADAGTVDKIE